MQAGHQGGVHLFIEVSELGDVTGVILMWAISQCPQQQVLLKLGGACKDRTGGTHHKRTTIKHEVVLTAYLVRIHQGAPNAAARCAARSMRC